MLSKKKLITAIAPTGLLDTYFRNYKVNDKWKKRIQITGESEDNQKIKKVPGAGAIRRGKQLMHNGLKVHVGSYYGFKNAILLMENEGVHEPQEEYVFQEILPFIKQGGTMIEMGSFWGFYSMWFQSVVQQGKNFLIEPIAQNLESGRRNFSLNNLNARFFQYFISDKSTTGNPPTIAVDDFTQENAIDFVDILHSDIQGYEYKMLLGAENLFSAGRVGYVFISTHSEQLHQQCLDYLQQKKYIIVAEAGMKQTFSLDGVIVARHPDYPGPATVTISKRNPNR
jgi:hypothetical protein